MLAFLVGNFGKEVENFNKNTAMVVAACGSSCCSGSLAASRAAQSNWGSARQNAFQASVPAMYIAAVA
jgi:hypothetical protein